MPYKTISELPETFKNLPDDAKKIALAVINELLDKGEKEASAILQAWGAVKKSYKQDKDGNWTKLEESMGKEKQLETVDIDNVEILAVGKWDASPKTVEFKKDDLKAIVDAFDELTANEKLNYEPPAKLGHDEGQKLAQNDGFPAVGWVSALKMVGDKLIATLSKVPKKVGEIIMAGGYKKISPEIYSNYEIGGKKYRWVLKAVSLLGADIPAIKAIKDIQALYAENEPAAIIVMYEAAEGESLNQKANKIRDAWYQQVAPKIPIAKNEDSWCEEVFDDSVIVHKDGKLFRVSYTETDKGIAFDTENAVEVKLEQQYIPVATSGTESDDKHKDENTGTEVSMDEKVIREVLKLDEKADVLATIKALQTKAEGTTIALSEHQAAVEENRTLKLKLAERERDERVSRAIQSGKITPAMKPQMEKIAMSDPSGFDALVATLPVVVKLGEIGTPGNQPEEIHLTEEEMKVAEKLGLSKEDLIKSKKQEGNK
jgi:cation transport regulator ChaB